MGGVIKQFVYGEGGQNLIVLDGSSNILQDEIYVGGRHLATLVNGASTLVPEWELSDWLGTVRMAANTSGAPVDSYTSWPFGAYLDHVGIVSNFHFTDKYHDSETGFDYFGARYYSSGVGRFLTPDWSKNPEGVPYANYANPQSLNLYSYVLNNPATAADPDGHWCFLGLFGSTCGQGNANSTDQEGTLNTTSRTPKKSLAVVAAGSVAADATVEGAEAGSIAGPPGVLVGALVGAAAAAVAAHVLAKNGNSATGPRPSPKAPGAPTAADGYAPPRQGAGAGGELVKNPNGPGRGYLDKTGDVWVPTGEGPTAHGGPHWDVQSPDGSYRNVYPGGRIRPGGGGQ